MVMAEEHAHLYRFEDADMAFSFLYEAINAAGQLKSGTKYFRNVSIELKNPLSRHITAPWRKWSLEYARLEWKWYLTGDRNPDMVAEKAKIWDSIRDEHGLVFSNYGFWWKRNNQLSRMIDLLKSDIKTRRAILVHYDVFEVQNFTKDTPCNVVLNFYVDNNMRLCLTVFARSIDLVYGFCNDQYCFSRLLENVAIELGPLPVGTMTYFVTDLHIYEKHYDMKEKFFNKQ